MTKEELKKEAEEYRKEIKSKFFLSEPQLDLSCQGYIDGLKAREKQIAQLGERCLQLQKDKGNLTDRVRDLEQKIEKMKHTEQKVMNKLWKEWDMLLGVSN